MTSVHDLRAVLLERWRSQRSPSQVADVEMTCDAAGRVGFVPRLGDSQTQGYCDVGGMTARLHLDASSTSLPSDRPSEAGRSPWPSPASATGRAWRCRSLRVPG